MTSCHLSIDHSIDGHGVGLYKVKYTHSDETNFEDMHKGDKIQGYNGKLSVTFKDFDDKEGSLLFEVCDAETDSCENLKFVIQWWTAFNNLNAWIKTQNSGDYIFRPAGYEPNAYNSFKYGTKSNGKTLDFYLD